LRAPTRCRRRHRSRSCWPVPDSSTPPANGLDGDRRHQGERIGLRAQHDLDGGLGELLRRDIRPAPATAPRGVGRKALRRKETRPEKPLRRACVFEVMRELVDHLGPKRRGRSGDPHRHQPAARVVRGPGPEVPRGTERYIRQASPAGRKSMEELLPGRRRQRANILGHRGVDVDAGSVRRRLAPGCPHRRAHDHGDRHLHRHPSSGSHGTANDSSPPLMPGTPAALVGVTP
jgi:hypothetical protein